MNSASSPAQIKGQKNILPDKKHWQRILDLLKYTGVEKIEERGQYAGNKEGFLDFREWLMSELKIKESAWNDIKEELMSYINRWSEKPFKGVSIGFKMEEDADGVIR